jgi:hypothetical protein
MTIRLYLDEDTTDTDLLEALRVRDIDVVATAPSGRGGPSDDDQLRWTPHNDVSFTALIEAISARFIPQ